jgi:photosystem II stability/assembly factor-like uncharacterized protein
MWGGDIWRRVDFVDINTGYFFSSGGIGKLYKTINGGKDWQVFNDTIFCNVLKGFDENIFLCEEATASLAGIIHRTIDGGQNWESEQFDFLDWGYDIEFTAGNSSNVWCASAPLSFSSDTGRTWVKEFNAPNGLFLDIVFTDENNGWLFEGVSRELINIYRTTNGGIGGIVSVDNEIDFRPDGFILEQNYPNPFNPTTIIRYQISEISFVTIKVYDVLGNEISRMVNEEKPAGEYGVEFDGDGLTSGIYFYQLRAGDYTDTKKMILLR